MYELLGALWDLAVPVMLIIILWLVQDRSELQQHNAWLLLRLGILRDDHREADDRLHIAQVLHHDAQQALDDARAELRRAHTVNSHGVDLLATANDRLTYAEAEIDRLQQQNFQLRLHLLRQSITKYITVHTN